MTHNARLVVFDFDGTICDSAGVKTRAFHELYRSELGEVFADAVRDYHLRNAGVSRYDKIRHIESVMLGKEPDEARVYEVAERFGRLVEDAVVTSPLIMGVADFFRARPRSVSVAVASATPTDELRRIVDRRGLDSWFDAVEGSPTPKGEILASFVQQFQAEPQTTVMVGDQMSDLHAAEYAGTRFIAVATDPGVEFPDGTTIIPNLQPLSDHLVGGAGS